MIEEELLQLLPKKDVDEASRTFYERTVHSLLFAAISIQPVIGAAKLTIQPMTWKAHHEEA
jgi:hypothetical protein